MIYKKDANFPYPILTNASRSYRESELKLDIQLQENVHTYRFSIDYELTSPFLTRLIELGKAVIILIIQSKDNKFYVLQRGQDFVEVPKSRISLSKRTSLQLHIQATEEISFKENNELNDFYDSFKGEITVPKHSILGFSNIVLFEGSSVNPLQLFAKKLDPSLTSDLKVELSSELIVIHYRQEDFQFGMLPHSKALNNSYIYLGLSKALQQFIYKYSEKDEDSVDLTQLEAPENILDFKLYQLMRKKMVDELNIDVLDEVIYLISDRVIEKFATAVKELASSGS